MTTKTILDHLKNGIGLVVLLGALLMSVGAALYKVSSIEGIILEVHAQNTRISVIEEKTRVLGELRHEDLTLLRKDIQELKSMIQNLDSKMERLRR